MKKYDFAMADYSKIIELNPNNARAYNGRANICLIQEEFSKALEDADKAIRLEPANYIFHITKGQIFKSIKMYLEAIYEFSISQSLNEKDSKSYSYRSECYRAWENSFTLYSYPADNKCYNGNDFRCSSRIWNFSGACRYNFDWCLWCANQLALYGFSTISDL